MTLEELLITNVKRLREMSNLSQAELARRSHISAMYMSEIERGVKTPSLHTVEKIAGGLVIEPYKLLVNINDSNRNLSYIIDTHFRALVNRDIDHIRDIYKDVL